MGSRLFGIWCDPTDLGLPRASVEEILAEIQEIGPLRVFCCASWLNMNLAISGPLSAASQDLVATPLLSARLLTRAQGLIAQGYVLVSRNALLYLQKLSASLLSNGQEFDVTFPVSQRVLLMAIKCSPLIWEPEGPSTDSTETSVGDSQEDTDASRLRDLRQQMALQQIVDPYVHFAIWRRLTTGFLHGMENTSSMDAGEYWEQVLGFELEDYYLRAASVFTFYYRWSRTELIPLQRVDMTVETFFERMDVPQDDATSLFSRICTTPEVLSERFSLLPDPERYDPYTYMTFFEFPLLEITPNRALCIDRDFLLRRLSELPLWLALQHAERTGSTVGTEDVRAEFGKTYEQYLRGQFNECFPHYTLGAVYENEDERSDCVLEDRRKEVVVIEGKSTRLFLSLRNASTVTANTEFLQRVLIGRKPPKGFGQILLLIRDLLEGGHSMRPPVRTTASRARYLGLVVLPDFVPMTPDTATWLDAEIEALKSEYNLTDRRIRLRAVVLDDLLVLAHGANWGSFIKILKEWIGRPDFLNQPLDHFLHMHFQQIKIAGEKYFRDDFVNILEQIETLFIHDESGGQIDSSTQ